MVSLLSLWLPIVVSVVAIFVASSVIWMVLPIHKKDYRKLKEKEPGVLEAVRSWGLAPGVYIYPSCDPETMKSDPDAKARYARGPWGTMTIMAGPVNMGMCLGMWVLNLAIISFIVAYLASHAGPGPGATFHSVFRLVFTMSFLAYGGNVLTDSIWKGRPWALFPGSLLDALVYAGITGCAFAALWPGK